LEDGYRIASLKVPFVWKAMFKANEIKANMRFAQAFTGAMARLGLRTILDEWRPTIVVCVHHLLLAEVSRMLRKRPSMRGIVVATDPFVPPAYVGRGARVSHPLLFGGGGGNLQGLWRARRAPVGLFHHH
jgi:hypothetical protein